MYLFKKAIKEFKISRIKKQNDKLKTLKSLNEDLEAEMELNKTLKGVY